MGMNHGGLILKMSYRAYCPAFTVSDNFYTQHDLATIFVLNVQAATDRGNVGSTLGLQNICILISSTLKSMTMTNYIFLFHL